MKAEKVIFIVAAGELGGDGFFLEMLAGMSPALVICADGGARHLAAVGVRPDIVIGDMDSIDSATLLHYEESGCRIVRHSQRKDETDTELALREALDLDPAQVWIWGAMGGRIDHTLANISLLSLGIKREVLVKLVDRWCEVFMIDRKTVIAGEEGQTVSLLPATSKVTGITLGGFEYPLKDGRMEMGHPYGISNRLAESKGVIEIGAGMLLVVRYFDRCVSDR
jgi:thiamine pyrophosphokinase